VSTIEEALEALVPSPNSIHVSILSQCVIIRHPPSLSSSLINEAIEDSGFDIADSTAPAGLGQSSGPSKYPFSSRRTKKHLEKCLVCQHEFKDTLGKAGVTTQMEGPLHVALSVGGMTCASCSSTLTRLLSELVGVTDVSVNLMGNSATLVVESKKLIPEVQDVIDSAGYEVSVVNVEPVQAIPDASRTLCGRRTVALRIEGMSCE
jgi:Cu+-exporting ATPase